MNEKLPFSNLLECASLPYSLNSKYPYLRKVVLIDRSKHIANLPLKRLFYNFRKLYKKCLYFPLHYDNFYE